MRIVNNSVCYYCKHIRCGIILVWLSKTLERLLRTTHNVYKKQTERRKETKKHQKFK